MNKTICHETQMKLVQLVCQDKSKEAHQLESNLRKNNLEAIEGVDRLLHALSAGITCKKENMNTPNWVKNNLYMEQCFSTSWNLHND